jgi:hypothetical protein
MVQTQQTPRIDPAQSQRKPHFIAYSLLMGLPCPAALRRGGGTTVRDGAEF